MKNQFQDIIPSDKRSIRNIPLPEKKRSSGNGKILSIRKIAKLPSEDDVLEGEREELVHLSPSKRRSRLEEMSSYPEEVRQSTRGGTRFFLWAITIAVVIALFISVISIFKSATVYITQKTTRYTLSGPMTFYLNPKIGQEAYSVITVADSVTAEVIASGEKQVLSKASGTIVIYNNFSTATQKLVSGTRFETPSGLVFRLNDTVTVPGLVKSKGKTTPGSIEGVITAEKAGSDYNIPLSDFTIPAFKGDPKYSGFYARSKTPLTGGSSGTIATVDDAVLSSAINELKSKLEASLREKAVKQLPVSQQTFDGFSKITYAVSDPKLLGGDMKGKAMIKVDGSARIYALDVASFAKKLLGNTVTSTSSVSFFTIDFGNVMTTLGSEASSTLSATLDGEAVVTWNVDQNAFKAAAVGRPSSEISQVVAAFPSVTKATVMIKPFSFFNPSIPKNKDNVTIIIQK